MPKKPAAPKRRSSLPKPVLTLLPTSRFETGLETRSLAGDLERSLAFVLRWEGGYVNDPDDPGGATNKGITQKVYDAYRRRMGLAPQAVRNISDAEVLAIYKAGYWDAVSGDKHGWPLNLVLFDTAVNMGPRRALEFLEQGKKLLEKTPSNDPNELSRRVIDLRVNRYYRLVQQNPKLKKFLQGWLNRMRDLKQASGYNTPLL